MRFCFSSLSMFKIQSHFTPLDVLNPITSLSIQLLQPNKGRITVGGEDVRTFDKSEWARVVSLVNQVTSLIS